MRKKTFIGYDLGDGETITDLLTLDERDIEKNQILSGAIKTMTMPDSNQPGKAIPTAYGYDEDGNVVFKSTILDLPEGVKNIHSNFKRRPSDLMKKVDAKREVEIINLFEKGNWPTYEECPEIFTDKMKDLKKAIITFTNAVFEDARYKERIRSAAADSDEIVICVGHPTRWNDLDVAIYKAIMNTSILHSGSYVGKPVSIVTGAESRAAFLYCKDQATSMVLPKDTCALLIDVGSSTIDVTAMTSDSRNHQYNSGSNYLGARSIDFLIREWYLEKLKKDPENWEVYQSLLEMNPLMDQALTLSCRMAKEDAYSVSSGIGKINFGDFHPVRLNKNNIDELAFTKPIAPILREYIGIPADQDEAMGNKTWGKLFQEFIEECKVQMTAQDIKIGRIILTGSASKMPFISEIVREIFAELPEDGILSDMDPTRSISQGLALVGPSNEKSKAFQRDLNKLIDQEVPKIIEEDIPKLADDISEIIESIIKTILKERMLQWRQNKIETLDDMSEIIKQDCSERKLASLLDKDESYSKAIQNWTVNIVGQDIAIKLKTLGEKYGVSNFSLDDLNVMKVPSIDVSTGKINPIGDMTDMIGGTIAVIAGIITTVMLPTIAALIIVLISYISVNIAAVLLLLLAAIPGWGLVLLATIAGVGVASLITNRVESFKQTITEKIQSYNLPAKARMLMTDNKIDKQIEEADIRSKVKEAILKDESKNQIIQDVTNSLKKQIAKRAEDIKYVIESR